jgi:hypothetical protein
MKVTTKDRMCQLASAANSSVWVLKNYLHKNHPEIIDEKFSRISEKNIGELISGIESILNKIAEGTDEKYWADIDIPGYTENSFPRKVSEM